MEFDDFVRLRLAELLRFAYVLVGDAERSEALVGQTLQAFRPDWVTTTSARPVAAVRAGVVRFYLRDERAHAVARPSGEFARLSGVHRVALVLSAYAGQTDAEIGQALELSGDEVHDARLAGLGVLGFGDGGERSDNRLRDVLDQFADGFVPDVSAVVAGLDLPDDVRADDAPRPPAEAVVDRLPADEPLATKTTGPEFVEIEPAAATPVKDEPLDTAPVDTEPLDTSPTDTEPPSLPGRAAVLDTRGGRALLLSAAVVVAAVLALLVSHRTDDRAAVTTRTASASPSPSVTTSSATPAPLAADIDRTLPGSRTLQEFLGNGPRTVDAAYAVTAGRQLLVNAVCSGSGPAQIGPVTFSRCTGVPSAAVLPVRTVRTVRVRAAASTTWRFVLVDSPPLDTDAGLRYPADTALTRSSLLERVGARSGTGSGRVDLTSGTVSPRSAAVRILVTCSGGGLSVSTADRELTDGRIGTCYRGWSYEFDLARTVLPGALTVTAPATEAWRVVVVRA